MHHVFKDKARAIIDRSRGFPARANVHAFSARLATQLDSPKGRKERPRAKMSPIREVWAPNLDNEMRNIRDLIDKYPFVALV